MRRGRIVGSGAAALALALAPGAAACPVCDSENGKQVRAGVFDGQFGWNLLRVVSPFPVALGAVGALYWLIPGPAQRAGARRGGHADA